MKKVRQLDLDAVLIVMMDIRDLLDDPMDINIANWHIDLLLNSKS